MIKKITKRIDNNFFEKHFPIFPRVGAKYKSLIDDVTSLFNYYVLSNRKFVFPPISDSFGISTTTFCNAKCGYCAYRCLKDKKEILPFNLFKKVVDEFYSLGGRKIGLTPTVGDVLIDKEFFKKVKYLRAKGIKTSLYTNAILLEANIENFISIPVDDLHVDLGDILPEIDSKIFNIPLEQSKKRLKAILTLLKEIDKKEIKQELYLDFRGKRTPGQIIRDLEKSEFNKYHKKGLFKMAFLQAYDNWGGIISKKDLLGVQTLKIPPKFKKYPCKNLFVLSLLPNGDLRLCGCRCKETLKDELVIGNIKDNSLKETYGSKKHKELIKNFVKGEFPIVCKDCSFYRAKIQK